MEEPPGDIVGFARDGDFHCAGCPAHQSNNCNYVNPGLSDYSADIMFVTEEPKHHVDWDNEVSWGEWNKKFMSRYSSTPGGQFMNRLLKYTLLNIGNAWIADSIKCPTKSDDKLGTSKISSKEAFQHCKPYLKREINDVNPNLIVALGNKAGERTLEAMGVHSSISILSDCGEVITDVEPEIPVLLSPHWTAQVYYPEETNRCIGLVQSKISEFFPIDY